MRISAVLLAVAMTCLFAMGQETKPNTLTPKDAADGWLQLFDGASTFGWKVEGTAMAKDGILVLGGDQATNAWFSTSFGFGDLSFAVNVENAKEAQFLASPLTERLAALLKNDQGWQPISMQYRPESLTLMTKGVGLKGGTFQHQISPEFRVPKGQKLLLRNIKFRPTNLQSIFNGKDLAGWKEHAGKKSKFAVIDGALNVKDGPGDLQTEGQWGDFTLQLECKSNGKHLNSGVFFRCIPELYQQGYEAQVRNEFTPESREYTVEVFDPATHKPLEKRKVQSPAIDFGTGAIYRRMPARSAVAKDGEWFTMTVIANGRHIATWVNGVQQVDWTDNRPAADNGRNGFRAAKGPISLQGHDPTTDLSFRNFRIAELP